jgi:hypothetical protein
MRFPATAIAETFRDCSSYQREEFCHVSLATEQGQPVKPLYYYEVRMCQNSVSKWFLTGTDLGPLGTYHIEWN